MQIKGSLNRILPDVLSRCFDHGMRMPMMICIMSRNGSAIVIRCVPDREEPIILAERNQDDLFTNSSAVLALDQGGRTLKLLVDQGHVSSE